jgi:uncharacterized damage-inducible protein DinB
MQSDQATFLLNAVFAPSLEREHATTWRVIEAIPLDKGDYRPEPVAKSAFELAWHIVASEKRFLEAIISGAFDFTPVHRPDSVKNSADIARWYKEMFASMFARLKQASPEQLAKVVDFRGVMQMPAILYCTLAVSHSVHHRGQLSTYLRPMGGKVPAIYGESYDSAEARKAAEAAKG